MPRTHLFDTSVYSQPVRKTMHAAVAARMTSIDDQSVAVSAICEAEVLFGLRKNGSPQMAARFDSLLKGRFHVLPIDRDVAETYATLRAACEKKGVTVGDMDLLIAATAKTHGLTVATLNCKDFTCIDGVLVEDWSLPPPPPGIKVKFVSSSP